MNIVCILATAVFLSASNAAPARGEQRLPADELAPWLGVWQTVLQRPLTLDEQHKLQQALSTEAARQDPERADDISGSAARFMEKYNSSPPAVQEAMTRLAEALFRYTARQAPDVPAAQIALVLLPPDPPVSGAEFFNIPVITRAAYQALKDYLLFCANLAGKPELTDEESRAFERNLLNALAMSSPAVRSQYADFDMEYGLVYLQFQCMGEQADRDRFASLYSLVRQSAGLEMLPPWGKGASPDLGWWQKARKLKGWIRFSFRDLQIVSCRTGPERISE